MSPSIEAYVAQQPELAWRRTMMRRFIRVVGFGALWQMDITGRENIPDTGPAIIMMNHISMIDPVLCMGAILNRFVIPMTKVENMKNPVIGPLVRWWGAYSVDRDAVDRKALINSIELVKSGQLILIAPEGHRQKDGLTQPKDGLSYVATKADAVIIPTGIAGAQDWADRLKRAQRPAVRLHFGRPFRFRTEGRSRIPREELALMSQEAMYQLASAVQDEALRGVYHDLSQATTDTLEFVG
ncbi:MAG: 1-acyl-sn-glycerol-3-phosphate acyltransferase [Anaerolineaceae bacterium]|nr:1-acyl-sn-glycerol-3-phosphate acyltransferase [Anaerolineaceae bacterium]